MVTLNVVEYLRDKFGPVYYVACPQYISLYKLLLYKQLDYSALI